MVNFREAWRGHLWQGRFASFVLDEPYLLSAARYVELNPVRAGSVNTPRQYRWSSATAHFSGKDDALVTVASLLQLAPDWRRFLTRVIREEDLKILRSHEHNGRPLGEEAFLESLERNVGRILRRKSLDPRGTLGFEEQAGIHIPVVSRWDSMGINGRGPEVRGWIAWGGLPPQEMDRQATDRPDGAAVFFLGRQT